MTAAEVTNASVIGQGRRLDRAVDEYAACLAEIAQRPDELMRVADAVQRP